MSFLRRLFVENWTLKVLAGALAAVLYFYVQSEREVTTTLTPQLVLQVPAGTMNTAVVPDQVKVVVNGSWAAVSAVGRQEPPPIQIDLTGFGPGPVTYYLDETLIRLPSNVRVASIIPAAISVDLEPVGTKSVPVRATLQGEPAYGYRLGAIDVSPRTVELTGPRAEIQRIAEVGTEPVDVEGATAEVSRQVRVAIPQPHVSRSRREPVTVTIPVIETTLERTMENLHVILPPGTNAVVRPDTVSVRIAGPTRIVEPLTAGGIRVSVPAARVPPPGERATVAVDVVLPDGVRVAGAPPKVTVETRR